MASGWWQVASSKWLRFRDHWVVCISSPATPHPHHTHTKPTLACRWYAVWMATGGWSSEPVGHGSSYHPPAGQRTKTSAFCSMPSRRLTVSTLARVCTVCLAVGPLSVAANITQCAVRSRRYGCLCSFSCSRSSRRSIAFSGDGASSILQYVQALRHCSVGIEVANYVVHFRSDIGAGFSLYVWCSSQGVTA